jgi:hypothetical protein
MASVSKKNQKTRGNRGNNNIPGQSKTKKTLPSTQPIRFAKDKLAERKQYLITSAKWPVTLQPTVTVACPFEQAALQTSFMSLVSYLNQRGITNVDSSSNPQSWEVIYKGINYLYQATGKLIQGQQVDVDSVPIVVNALIAALQGKQIRFKEGKISYGWSLFDANQLLTPVPVCNGTWATTYTTTDLNSYDSPASIYAPSAGAQEYSQFIRLIGEVDSQSKLKFVKLGTKTNVSGDVSAFSRVYVYDGLQGPALTGGYWKDLENEVPVRAPIFGNYCTYVQPDQRVPRSLLPFSGSPTLPMLWPLFDTFRSYYNKTPPVFNQINFDEFFILYSLWLANLQTSRCTNGPDPGPIQCTPQDAYITLYNAFMYQNNMQSMTQFTGDVKFDGTTNCFVPFLVMGHNSGNSAFGRLQVPTILAENYNCLLARSLCKQGRGQNQLSYLPVLGRYWKDEMPSQFQYKLPDGTLRDLYGSVAAQVSINITDCSKGPAQYVNVVGSYYQGIMGILNDRVESLQNLSAAIQDLAGDGGPRGMFLAGCTRILGNSIQDMKRNAGPPPQPPRVPLPYAYKIKNNSSVRLEGSPLVIPPASIMSLYTNSITAAFPCTEEMKELVDLMILPSTRLNETEDALSMQMIQTIKCEPFNFPYQQNNYVFSGTGEFTRLNTYAGLLVPGVGRDNTNKLLLTFDKITRDGSGGALAQLLAGAGKMFFPDMGSMLDTVAAIVPF